MDELRQRGPLNEQPDAEDAFDEVFLEPIEPLDFEPAPVKKNRRRSRKAKQKRTLIILACCTVALVTTVAVLLFVSNQKRVAAEIAAQVAQEEALRQEQERQRAEFESLANAKTFLDGITVQGVKIGGMTVEEARAALSDAAANVKAHGQLQLTLESAVYAVDLDAVVSSTDLEQVLTEAYKLGKSGDYTAMKTEAEDVQKNGRAYTLKANYNLAALTARVAEIAAQIDTLAKNAAVSNVNTEERTIEFTDEAVGVTVQQDALIQAISQAIAANSTAPIAIPVVTTEPTVTKADLAAKYVMRGSATTSFSDSSSSRKANIRKGAGMITGTVLKPGETFSTNDTLGTRTTKNGWKNAGAYENGAVVEQAGGGVCQLSTTLYNAVVKSDLEIVSRRNHSMKVAYIEPGLDATINSVGNIIDFKFKNNTSSDLVIFSYTIDNKKLTFEIWGVPFNTDAYDEIKLTSKQTAVYEPNGEPTLVETAVGTEKPNGSLMEPGEEYTAVTARKGYQYQSYKNYYKNGELVRSDPLATSTYKAFNGEIWITPGESPSPTPNATPTPDEVLPQHTPDPGYNNNNGGGAPVITPPPDGGGQGGVVIS